MSSTSTLNGSQTLFRGMAIIESVAQGNSNLRAICGDLNLSRSTAHRLVNALVQANYLRRVTGNGYLLGPRLIELGTQSLNGYSMRQAARPYIEQLAELTQDTVHLGIREQDDVLYIDKIPGTRGLEMRSRVGQRMPLAMTGIGKALLLGGDPEQWIDIYKRSNPNGDVINFVQLMQNYASGGYSFDLEENELAIRCVAAPIYDASYQIIAAISVASISQYMPDQRMQELIHITKSFADNISSQLGWRKK